MLQIYLDSSNCKPGDEEQTGAGTKQNKSLGQFVEPVLCGPCATQAFVFSGMKHSLNSCFTKAYKDSGNLSHFDLLLIVTACSLFSL